MATEPKEIKVKVGTKLTDAEVKALDPKDVGRTHAQPKKAPVEGQDMYVGRVGCPYCGATNVIWESTNVYRYFTCWNCGGTFRA